MRKVYVLYDVEGTLVGVISDKFYKSGVDLIDAVQEYAEFKTGKFDYFSIVDSEESTMYDTVDEMMKANGQ